MLFVINALGIGGAESMLFRLLSHLDRTRFDVRVVSLRDVLDPFGDRIRALGIPVCTLGMRRGRPNPGALLRLAKWIRKDPPDVVHTWQYHADLLGGLAVRLAGRIPVAWGIHNSDLSATGSKRLTLLTAKTCARLSRWLPTQIVCCSEVSRDIHVALGYQAEKMLVIPNGADVSIYHPDPSARKAVRHELQIPDNAPLIGMMARFDPQKDHHNFMQAAKLLHLGYPDAHFLLCGTDVNRDNPKLMAWVHEAGIQDRCHLLGVRHDIDKITASLDIATLSSAFGEAFPMTVVESMSTGVPCVVTNVGDSAKIVGETGHVVPPRNPAALASAWKEMIELGEAERMKLGMAARRRTEEHFNLPTIAHRYEALFENLVLSSSN